MLAKLLDNCFELPSFNVLVSQIYFILCFVGQDVITDEIRRMSTEEIISRTRLLDNEIKIMKSELLRVSHELQAQNEKIRENTEKIKVNKTLPYLVSNVIEVSLGITL